MLTRVCKRPVSSMAAHLAKKRKHAEHGSSRGNSWVDEQLPDDGSFGPSWFQVGGSFRAGRTCQAWDQASSQRGMACSRCLYALSHSRSWILRCVSEVDCGVRGDRYRHVKEAKGWWSEGQLHCRSQASKTTTPCCDQDLREADWCVSSLADPMWLCWRPGGPSRTSWCFADVFGWCGAGG